MDFKERMIKLRQHHEELLTRENKPVEHLGNGIYQKYLFPILTELAAELLQGYGIQSVFDKSSATVPGGSEDRYLWGIEPQEWEIKEQGRRMLINFFEGQKTGFFIDQRENRNLVASLAKSQH